MVQASKFIIILGAKITARWVFKIVYNFCWTQQTTLLCGAAYHTKGKDVKSAGQGRRWEKGISNLKGEIRATEKKLIGQQVVKCWHAYEFDLLCWPARQHTPLAESFRLRGGEKGPQTPLVQIVKIWEQNDQNLGVAVQNLGVWPASVPHHPRSVLTSCAHQNWTKLNWRLPSKLNWRLSRWAAQEVVSPQGDSGPFRPVPARRCADRRSPEPGPAGPSPPAEPDSTVSARARERERGAARRPRPRRGADADRGLSAWPPL